jgi:hypothetical protein
MSSHEVRQVVQLLQRSTRSAEEAIDSVVQLRPQVTRQFVYLATVTDEAVRRKLAELTQAERNQLLSDALQRLRLGRVNGRLGIDRFSLTANEEAAERLDIDQVEGALNAALVASLSKA